MKKLYIIGGTMEVGKTATCQILKQKLDNSIFPDLDISLWQMKSRFFTLDYSLRRKMVHGNIW